MAESLDHLKQIFAEAKAYAELRIAYGKLTAAEKLTTLLSVMALSLILLLLGVTAFAFLSVAAVDRLSDYIGMPLSCLSMCGFYLLIGFLLVALRKPLVINPVARLITRLILK